MTDYWVSCEDQSCTTTASAVVTGCYVTATATTTGAYCPTSISLDYSDDDEGDDATDLPNPGNVVTVTYPEIVVAGTNAYSVSGGSVVIGGVAYGVPSVNSPETTSLGGQQVVIYPEFTGAGISITLDWITITDMQPSATSTDGASPTSAIPWPTNTDINTGDAYCFTSSMGYVEFTDDQAKSVIQSFCDAKYVLDPSNTYGQVEETTFGSYSVVVSAAWAKDQSGCGTMDAWSFADSSSDLDLCLNAWSTDFYCGDETGTDTVSNSYGGGYVYTTGNGCILLELYAQ